MSRKHPDKPWRLMPWMTTRISRMRWHWLMHIDHWQGENTSTTTTCAACGYQPCR